ncbi:Armadillo repeat-containing protein 6-like protein [Armadillidium nasatum]|uniref:Armadillo repeat-containing protein 6-like protein n=1 Tax=Armadillidium nasatum TaxID=96803 RepID=A0A5N5SWR9_9CRUS|nr:Armadillo repeat-containing protein 6-like protein [Armadillidium nasatum]
MKVISQETFDEVVLENVRDFDNPLQEAIEEATKEFEAQGVNLGNIVMNMKISEDNEKIIHEVLESLESLRNRDSFSMEKTLSLLDVVYEECKLTLAHRVLATKYDGYNILLSIIKENKTNDKILAAALNALSALSMTNPDILNKEGVDVMVDLFQDCSSIQNPNVIKNLSKWCLECCLKHERNRQVLVQAEIPQYLVMILKNCISNDRINSKVI